MSGEKYGEVGEIAGDNEVNAWINAGRLPDGTSVSSKIKKTLHIVTPSVSSDVFSSFDECLIPSIDTIIA